MTHIPGNHGLLDLYGCDEAVLKDEGRLKTALKAAAQAVGATILAERLSATQCKLHLEDFEGSEVVEFGIEAVNRFGVSTPCLEGLSRRISELKMELRAMRR